MESKKKKVFRFSISGFLCAECKAYVNEPRKRSGVCTTCGLARMTREIAELRARHGPYFEKWLAGIQKGITKVKK